MVAREPSVRLDLVDVRFGFPSRPDFLGPIRASIRSGECWAIVGPNGAGKSTLLRLMAGLWKPRAGAVVLNGRSLLATPLRARAKRVAFVPQSPPTALDFSVRDIVLMGRFPHRAMGLFESTEDSRIARRAMEITETLAFANRPLATLSGGEAQRVHVAAALAQEPQFLLLDEPTASLDLQHQLGIFRILHDRAADDGLGVVVVTHDVNLASRFCGHVMLLDVGRCVAAGPPETVLTPATLSPVYGVELTSISLPPGPGRRWVVPLGPLRAGES